MAKRKGNFWKIAKRKSWKRTSKNPYIIYNKMMREIRLLRKNKKISHFIVGEIVSTIKGKKLIKSYITREKGGFRLNHFEYEDPLSEKIRNRKARAELNLEKKRQ